MFLLVKHTTPQKFHKNSSRVTPISNIIVQEAQLMLTTGATRLAVSRGQQTQYHSI